MNRQPIVKLDVNNPAAWAMLAYAAIRGGVGGPYTDRLSGLEEWREKAGKWALVYDADAVEEEVDRLLYDSLSEYPDGFFLAADETAIFMHPAVLHEELLGGGIK